VHPIHERSRDAVRAYAKLKSHFENGHVPSERQKHKVMRRLEKSIKELRELNDLGVQIKKSSPRKSRFDGEQYSNDRIVESDIN